MIIEARVGPASLQDGVLREPRSAKTGELVTSDVHGKYYEAVSRGGVYFLAAGAQTPTAYAGAAGGTPLIAIHNPTGSGKNLSLLAVSIANRAAASAAGVVSFTIDGGPSALPTGTTTLPTNMLSLVSGGAVAKGFVNVALTGSTALVQILSPFTYYWPAAAALMAAGYIDIAGAIIVIPGNQIAIGATAALTSATWDVTMIWEEVQA